MSEAQPSTPWTLMKLCREAEVPRGVARAAVRHQLIPQSGWTRNQIPQLKVAAVLLQLAKPDEDDDQVQARNRQAMNWVNQLAWQFQGDGTLNRPIHENVLLITSTTAHLEGENTLTRRLLDLGDGESVTCVPLGRWFALLDHPFAISA